MVACASVQYGVGAALRMMQPVRTRVSAPIQVLSPDRLVLLVRRRESAQVPYPGKAGPALSRKPDTGLHQGRDLVSPVIAAPAWSGSTSTRRGRAGTSWCVLDPTG